VRVTDKGRAFAARRFADGGQIPGMANGGKFPDDVKAELLDPDHPSAPHHHDSEGKMGLPPTNLAHHWMKPSHGETNRDLLLIHGDKEHPFYSQQFPVPNVLAHARLVDYPPKDASDSGECSLYRRWVASCIRGRRRSDTPKTRCLTSRACRGASTKTKTLFMPPLREERPAASSLKKLGMPWMSGELPLGHTSLLEESGPWTGAARLHSGHGQCKKGCGAYFGIKATFSESEMTSRLSTKSGP